MEHEYSRTAGRDGQRRSWAPLAIVGGALLVVLVGLIVIFSGDDGDGGSVSVSLVATTTTPTTEPVTTVAATPAPVVVPRPDQPAPDDDDDAPASDDSDDPAVALQRLADDARAADVSDIVPIGSGSYAMLTIAGGGRLVRWDGDQWESQATIDPPGSIRSVQTLDLTGDGTLDFFVTLSGVDQPGGVFGRVTFAFEWLPFNTPTGPQDFIDHLEVQSGVLVSPDVDTVGRPVTVSWRWIGRTFEPG